MRTREEIEETYNEHRKSVTAEIVAQGAILEVLLDIRDLLTK